MTEGESKDMLVLAAAMLAGSTPTTANPVEVDRALYDFFYGARASGTVGPMGAYVCGDPDRERQNREIYREYRRLERQYARQGGLFASDEEQEIISPTHYSTCPQDREGRRNSASLWEEAANSAEARLAEIRRLLAQQRRARRQQAEHE